MAHHLMLVRHRLRPRSSSTLMREIVAEFAFIGGIIAICTTLTIVCI